MIRHNSTRLTMIAYPYVPVSSFLCVLCSDSMIVWWQALNKMGRNTTSTNTAPSKLSHQITLVPRYIRIGECLVQCPLLPCSARLCTHPRNPYLFTQLSKTLKSRCHGCTRLVTFTERYMAQMWHRSRVSNLDILLDIKWKSKHIERSHTAL